MEWLNPVPWMATKHDEDIFFKFSLYATDTTVFCMSASLLRALKQAEDAQKKAEDTNVYGSIGSWPCISFERLEASTECVRQPSLRVPSLSTRASEALLWSLIPSITPTVSGFFDTFFTSVGSVGYT